MRLGDRVVVEVVGTSDSIGMHTLPVLVGSVVSSKNPTLHLRRIRINTYKTLFIKIEYGVVPKKLIFKFRANFLSPGVFDHADYESDG